MLTSSVAGAAPFTVVIDPGHGGSNTGAPGAVAQVYEKSVTLKVAYAMKRRLESAGVRVVLTRGRDTYLTLRERARRASVVEADCFVSLHTNASPLHTQRGVETYVLAKDAADVEARRIAGRASDDVAGLVAEIERLDAHRTSVELAEGIQRELVRARTTQTHDRGVRQAAYDVLAELSVPAVLVEIGFIDHPVEGAELARADVQAKIARALSDGVLSFRSRKLAPELAALDLASKAK